ncbi:putative Protoporphyrinogen oxidase [Seiridium cardinale]|uniref:Protoporphyrinogen oxidase n=1 Tax=Seiridium cardinale TaxID=138064 RepID=A0ABR2Y3J9_9PEZI
MAIKGLRVLWPIRDLCLAPKAKPGTRGQEAGSTDQNLQERLANADEVAKRHYDSITIAAGRDDGGELDIGDDHGQSGWNLTETPQEISQRVTSFKVVVTLHPNLLCRILQALRDQGNLAQRIDDLLCRFVDNLRTAFERADTWIGAFSLAFGPVSGQGPSCGICGGEQRHERLASAGQWIDDDHPGCIELGVDECARRRFCPRRKVLGLSPGQKGAIRVANPNEGVDSIASCIYTQYDSYLPSTPQRVPTNEPTKGMLMLGAQTYQDAGHQRHHGSPTMEIAIFGGGITGLATAYYATHRFRSAHITIFEASSRLGGSIESTRLDVSSGSQSMRFLYEKGPRTLRVNAPRAAVKYELIQSRGLTSECLTVPNDSPVAGTRYILYPKHLVGLPAVNSPAIRRHIASIPAPSRLGLSRMGRYCWLIATEPLFHNLITGAFCDFFIARRPEGLRDESIGQFVTWRWGSDFTDNFLSAIIHGLYAGDINQLSVKSLMPKMWELEKQAEIHRRRWGPLIGMGGVLREMMCKDQPQQGPLTVRTTSLRPLSSIIAATDES